MGECARMKPISFPGDDQAEGMDVDVDDDSPLDHAELQAEKLVDVNFFNAFDDDFDDQDVDALTLTLTLTVDTDVRNEQQQQQQQQPSAAQQHAPN